MPFARFAACPLLPYNPLVSQLGKPTRGFVHDGGSLRCLGRF
jgi:hypothetical protein